MKKLDTSTVSSLLCMELSSISFGYRVLADVTAGLEPDSLQARILEASPIGPGFMILILGELSCLATMLKTARELAKGENSKLLLDTELIDHAGPALLDGFFALAQTPLEEGLVVIESPSVSGCLSMAQNLMARHALKAIEIRIHRSSTGGAYAFLTGTKAACALAGKEKAPARGGRIEVIDPKSALFRRYFSLTGEPTDPAQPTAAKNSTDSH